MNRHRSARVTVASISVMTPHLIIRASLLSVLHCMAICQVDEADWDIVFGHPAPQTKRS